MHYFHLLVDPFPSTTGTGWDRTGGYSRRAYFSRFLVLSSGPDKEPGVAQFAKDYASLTGDSTSGKIVFPDPSATMEINALRLIFNENQALQSDPALRTGSFFEVPDASSSTTRYLQKDVGLDDISNHNIQAPSSGVR